jgi:hypothetical protein
MGATDVEQMMKDVAAKTASKPDIAERLRRTSRERRHVP